mgnify:CR=1 FL=1
MRIGNASVGVAGTAVLKQITQPNSRHAPSQHERADTNKIVAEAKTASPRMVAHETAAVFKANPLVVAASGHQGEREGLLCVKSSSIITKYPSDSRRLLTRQSHERALGQPLSAGRICKSLCNSTVAQCIICRRHPRVLQLHRPDFR